MHSGLLVLLFAAGGPTDFGIRTLAAEKPVIAATKKSDAVAPLVRGRVSLAAATRIGGRLGRVTSTWRSRDHNRRVGGAENSWHLHGRAIDIARAPGVSHAAIAAELRRNGFHLIESLDEGDHSHFAFADRPVAPARMRSATDQVAELQREANYFQFVTISGARRSSKRVASR